MSIPRHYSFTRYLAAKKSVDDRALNQHVWRMLARNLPQAAPEKPLKILEVGCGIGTMLERILELGLLTNADYTGIDAEPDNITHGTRRLPDWAAAHGFDYLPKDTSRWILSNQEQRIQASFENCDLFEFIARESGHHQWDLLVAHAFLDLMNIPDTLPQMIKILAPGGLVYFTINFDGATILEPEIDPELEEQIQAQYHRTMDRRIIDGRPSGDSRAGRHLFEYLRRSGIQVLDAGASDWVVFPETQGYPEDEAYFLHFIIHTIQQALAGQPQPDSDRLTDWVNERHAQIERGELIYIAHQLDFLGKASQAVFTQRSGSDRNS